MKILVTGCCGFIGSHLCQRLLTTTNYQIIGIDNMNDYYDQKQKKDNLNLLTIYRNFIYFKEDVITTKIVSIQKPDIVIHLAAMAGVRYSHQNPSLYIRNNIEGHTNLILQSTQEKVKLFIYASSSSVYGNNTSIPFQEHDSIDNLNSMYALSKHTCEMISQLYHKLYQLPVIGLRFFTVYGPRGRPDMAPYKFISKIMTGNPIDKYGPGDSFRDYTYIDDIVSGIMGAIKNKNNRTCEIYNLGNSQTHNLNQFINICEQVTGRQAIINQLGDQTGDVPATYSDISKAKTDLDYDPQTNLQDGLIQLYQWILEYHQSPSSSVIFNSEMDTTIFEFLDNQDHYQNYPVSRTDFEKYQLEQLQTKLINQQLQVTIIYSCTFSVDTLRIGKNNSKITIEFEDSQYELENKGLEQSLTL